ncbi:hypothetical protein AMJ86_04100 [bacterium SM23_57]|nr:MAG: hypothetical protein AMJ86_04100 [bacterium SM23_57]
MEEFHLTHLLYSRFFMLSIPRFPPTLEGELNAQVFLGGLPIQRHLLPRTRGAEVGKKPIPTNISMMTNRTIR